MAQETVPEGKSAGQDAQKTRRETETKGSRDIPQTGTGQNKRTKRKTVPPVVDQESRGQQKTKTRPPVADQARRGQQKTKTRPPGADQEKRGQQKTGTIMWMWYVEVPE
jgi:hypothetical protein